MTRHPAEAGPRRACRIVLSVVFATHAGGGCAALPLATLGTVAGFAATAVSTGRDVCKGGKLDTAEMAGFDDAVWAARRAAADLDLPPEKDQRHKAGTVADLTFADDRAAAAPSKSTSTGGPATCSAPASTSACSATNPRLGGSCRK
jgi:hypothetical protein